jgi:mono/diheme cytochrome c family protein
MRTYWPILLLLIFSLTGGLYAFQQPAEAPTKLTETQTTGRRIFQQRCAVCHTRVTLTSLNYGMLLSKELVDGNEDMIRSYIQNGSPRMPGFKYGLQASEIDAIIDYLKTVPKAKAQEVQKGGNQVE